MTIIYWIHYPEHKDPLTEGYVGISQNLDSRLSVHRTTARSNPTNPMHKELLGPRANEMITEIIFDGTSAECADEENRLRPEKYIGWNIDKGGKYNRRTPEEWNQRKILQGRKPKYTV
jgi:hypothetical protein